MRKVKVGVIGCGMISAIYLKNCTQVFNNVLDVVAVADLVPELAAKRAEEFNVPTSCSVEELLANPEVEIVLNLTAPVAHASVNLQALNAGKHVYTEKPFALNREDADEVLNLAESKGLLVGCAPDTFLGASIQTCLKLIEDGEIGQPYAANASIIMGNAADGMHPNFQNFLKLGGDPIMDMGPYYLTALVAMLGPVKRVTGSAQKLHEEVTITNEKSPRFGETFPVEAPTNVAATLDFHSGVVANVQATKESFGYRPRLEIFGTKGNLTVPDPNFFGPIQGFIGDITIQYPNFETKTIPLTHGFNEDSRGIGVADMAYAIQSGRKHRASGQLARHILDISLGIFEASESEKHVHIQSTIDRPAALPLGLKDNLLDK
ncbi:Gfo/Idh/MocA family oxidoreductase [Bacillus sp. FJAT-49732]|uniref:Gfo/Idh/MocA family oxidoreductase n=1 Tax=Lederbergia citrisecunda TaxID=2833583 RepID=A0A942TIH3_9BACI|nr:Gfo/Idh/MocA family oxidoreductase [Lederbergia citrisecunda]MBS4198645.1 Gfo/Idh/MocA family oxidoreductase [Lederbergia citrisecunda]